jgi:hypothetical protein
VVYQETYIKTAKLQILGLMECLVKRTILLIMYILIYHCERIHSGTSENLRQKWPRFGKFLCFDVMKKPYTDYVYTTVRGFTVVYQKNLRL